VSRWGSDLESQSREFNRMAGEVAVWDQVLIENGNQIASLYAALLTAETTQSNVNNSLDQIEQQQRDLSSSLDNYEKVTREIFEGQGAGGIRGLDVGPADSERDRSYTLAASLNTQLDELSQSLSSMIDSVNELTAPSTTSGDASSQPGLGGSSAVQDPMAQIEAILNAHLSSLQWIDSTVRDVETKVRDAETRIGDMNGNNGGGNLNTSGLDYSLRGSTRGFGLGPRR